MKKINAFLIIILNIFICTACGSNNTTLTKPSNSDIEPSASYNIVTDKEELKELFQKWDTSSIEASEKELIVTKFTDYLKTNKTLNEEELKEISESFNFNRLNDIFIISYVEMPDFYGQSGKLSFTWLIYKDTVNVIFNGDSKYINEIIQDKNDKNVYYLIGDDYLITTSTGVFISRITLKDDKVDFKKDVIELEPNKSFWKSKAQDQDGVLHSNSQLVIRKGNEDGTEIIVKTLNGNSSLSLYLTEDHFFKG